MNNTHASIIKFYRSLSDERKEAICNEAGTKVPYLRQLVFGHRIPSAMLAKKLHDCSDGGFNKHLLLPDIFGAPPKKKGCGCRDDKAAA